MSLRLFSTFLLLIPAMMFAQSSAPAAPAQKPQATQGVQRSPLPEKPATAAATEAQLPANAPVITIKGLCPPRPSAKAAKIAPGATSKTGCETVITKADFDKVMSAVIPPGETEHLPPNVKSQVAHTLVLVTIMAQKAIQQGVEKQPRVQERLMLERKRVLTELFTQKLLEDSKPSAAEIQKYYDENPTAYDEVTLERLYIPKSAGGKTPADPAAEKAAAEKIHDRAAAGEDFTKLQKEAWAGQPNPQGAPTTQMGARRRGSLPPDQEPAVFALNAGQVSQLFDNPAGWFIYKVVSKRKLPLSEVKDEISRSLQQQKFQDSREAIVNSAKAEYDPKYFGPPAPPQEAPEMGVPGHPMPSHHTPPHPMPPTPPPSAPQQ